MKTKKGAAIEWLGNSHFSKDIVRQAIDVNAVVMGLGKVVNG
jgi:hypothetical protein